MLSSLVRRGREIPALALAACWLCGLVLAPLAHLADHARLGVHSHAGEHGEHEHPSRVATSDDGSGDPIEHGRGSALHGDVAALFPSPAFLLPPFVPFGHRAEPAPLAELRGLLPPPVAVARGPPREPHT